ncbi:MAG: succinylglutamate desuccinylase/aspartoacylase family protein [Gammaproteobacteria bacterium]|nr:MAG: succinylglutamate desuccinylase/aspartoacylase family protein [Gammaproteobacteria bacterium]
MKHPGIAIGNTFIAAGQRQTLELPMASLYSHAPMNLPVQVVCGKQQGPRMFVSAAIHGDEINGVEIIRRLLKLPVLKKIRGTLLAVPIVNVYGFVNHSRYLPDRRDLNRSFPGSGTGSMASRLAELFIREIVSNSDYGIDLHTAAIHRDNLPQIRANLDNEETARIARVFEVPVMINANERDGSLREYTAQNNIPVLLYEAGEALRFNELAIRAGVKGIIAVMRELSMLPAVKRSQRITEPMVARSTTWVRAACSGILRILVPMGSRVRRNQLIGMIADPFGEQEQEVLASTSGIIIGRTNLPLVNEGEALFHIARFESASEAETRIEIFQNEDNGLYPDVNDEPPIV